MEDWKTQRDEINNNKSMNSYKNKEPDNENKESNTENESCYTVDDRNQHGHNHGNQRSDEQQRSNNMEPGKNSNHHIHLRVAERALYLTKDTGENDDKTCSKNFIRKLANDFIHFKIHGKSEPVRDRLYRQPESRPLRRACSSSEADFKPVERTSKLIRKVSLEMERSNAEFFDNVCAKLNLNERNAAQQFKTVSEQVLCKDALNWGRVVSLFTFGGKVAEWFWHSQQEDKIEEVEEWLAESLSSTEGWIEENGGWEQFNEKFQEESGQFNWLKPSLLICAGVSLAAVLTYKSL